MRYVTAALRRAEGERERENAVARGIQMHSARANVRNVSWAPILAPSLSASTTTPAMDIRARSLSSSSTGSRKCFMALTCSRSSMASALDGLVRLRVLCTRVCRANSGRTGASG